MLTEIGHVVFAVRDLAATRSFYGEQLGLHELGSGPNDDGEEGCCFRVGPSILELRLDPDARRGDEETGPRAEINHIALYVDDIAATYAALKDRDIQFMGPPESTAIGHRNMQRTLLAFPDPNGFILQISETIDPRPHHDVRKAAKARMAHREKEDGEFFGGIDHISTYCTKFVATRAFYTQTLGLDEFFYNNKRGEGEAVEAGFEQAAFAIGGTDIELATSADWSEIGPGPVRQLGLWTDDIDDACRVIGPDGLAVQIVQAV